MSKFDIHTIDTAPTASKALLQAQQEDWGFIPNLTGVLAEAPLALETQILLADQFAKSSFNPRERQIILMTISYENKCSYCMASHTVLAKMSGVDADVRERIREGKDLEDDKLEALRRFTSEIVARKGWLDEGVVDAFLAAGYAKAHVFEILIAVASKVLTSYTNHLAHTPYDEFQKETAWTHPSLRGA